MTSRVIWAPVLPRERRGILEDLRDPSGKGGKGFLEVADLNGDGVQQAGEDPLAGVTVKYYSAGVDGLLGTADDVLQGTAGAAFGAGRMTSTAILGAAHTLFGLLLAAQDVAKEGLHKLLGRSR